ncbi:FAD-binding protein [Rhodobacter sp. Har01]|uniref:FAD-binding protein n=1 Tax=Rhodobacter sp. Har01 TaxID=2883999 RepID=UPI001D0853B1|nr:FAD-binding protein [Rhodobacter sp. Har01]MCB6179135.1 FAD-binding protein [Rhodobacter sp. Har01]
MRPADEAELSEAIRGANGPLVVRGGGTRGLFGAGEALDTGGITGVRLYEPAALTLVAAAGTPLAEVEAVLAAERQRLAFEPADLRGLLERDGVSTIGGVAAENASGPRRVQVGAARDAMLGVRFVDGTGAVVANGGRVMKNVTGYDLVKLMAGSRGTLGVLTEVAFKVQAQPEAEATLVGEGFSAASGLAALRAALASPFDVSGAAFVSGQVLLRIEGMAGSVAYRAGRLRALTAGDWTLVEGAESAALWRAVRDVQAFAGRPGAVWRISCVPGEALAVPQALAAARVPHEALWDWGGGLLWLICPEGQGRVIRSALGERGHATRVRGDEAAPALPPLSPQVAALEAGLRARFDPRGLFAGGRG